MVDNNNNNNTNTQKKINSNNLDAVKKKNVLIESSKNKTNQCMYHSYFYSNQNTILNVFVMSYEEQLQKAIAKGNLELCYELIQLSCNLNMQKNRRLPLGIACEYNYYDIVELLLKVN